MTAQVIAVRKGIKIKNAPYRIKLKSAKKNAVTSQVRFTGGFPVFP